MATWQHFFHLAVMANLWRKGGIINYLPVYGCIATGIIYSAIGVIALLSFFKVVHGGADENSFLAILHESAVGTVFIWIILLGMLSYIVWRIYEVIRDPYSYGTSAKGLTRRTGIALSTIADMLIVYAAIQVMMGTANFGIHGQPDSERQLVSKMLQGNAGPWLVISIGCVLCVTALVQFFYGISQEYKERTTIDDHISGWKEKFVHVLAVVGYSARGFIIGITGFFLIKAGISGDAEYVVNTDKAFDFIGDHIGHLLFILTAIGTIAYGFFMVVLGITYHHDKD